MTLFSSLAFALAAAAPSDDDAPVGNFSLDDAHGTQHVLFESGSDHVGTVLAWTSLDCMVAKLYLPRLQEFAEEYGEQGIRVWGINPNIQDQPGEVVERMAKVGADFPILMDSMQAVTDQFAIERTTEVILLDRDHRVIYRGAIDDQYNVGASRPYPRNEWLVDAMECLLADEAIETPKTDPAGCLVGRIQDRSQIEVTFHRDIAPILNRHCVECHRPDQIGPMALTSFDDARGWAPMIAEVVGESRMPPWHANPAHGTFENRRMLTDTEKAQLMTWAEGGAPEGDAADAPEAPVFQDDGWAIGKPDHIIQLPEEQSIRATGTEPYRYIMVDPKIEEDRWVQSIEIRPTSTAATHHVLVLLVPPGGSRRDAFRTLSDDDGIGGGYFAVQVPGCRPNVYPEGMGKFLPAGSQFMFQMHYTPTGVPESDQTRVAFKWCDEVPDIEVKTTGVYNTRLDIKPHQANAVFTAEKTFVEGIKVLSMFPHMHARGAAFRFEKHSEDGTTILLDVPEYDFNWQNFYRPTEPVMVDSGETLHIRAVYDNSEANAFNPDPSERVRWGDQTWEEMMIGYLDYIDARPQSGVR